MVFKIPKLNENDCGEKTLRCFIFISSFFITLAGLGTLVGAIYLGVKGGAFNSIVGIFSGYGALVLIFTPILTLTMKRRPCVILIFIIYMFIVTAVFIVCGVIACVPDIMDDIAEGLEDSDDDIKKIKDALEDLQLPIQIVFLVISVFGIVDIITLIIYRHKEQDVLFDHESQFEEGDELLRSISKGNNKKEKLYDNDALDTPDLY